MKFKISSLALALLVPCPHGPKAEEQTWICIPDLATGMQYTEERWRSTGIEVSDERYLLKSSTNDEGVVSYDWTEFGSSTSFSECRVSGRYVHCSGLDNVTINMTTLKYQSYFIGGYLMQGVPSFEEQYPGQRPDDVVVKIGKCAAL